MVVDRHPDRLRLAEEIGAMPIDDSKVDPVEAVMEETNGRGADRGCECVGYQAHDPQGHEHPNDDDERPGRVGPVHRADRRGRRLRAPDPGGPDDLARQGRARFDFGTFWFKGQQMGTGQCPGQALQPAPARPHPPDKARRRGSSPTALPLERAPEAYQHFDAREQRLDQGRPQARDGFRLSTG